MALFDLFKKTEPQSNKKNKDLVPTNNSNIIPQEPKLHTDLENLVWIADGKFKNYKNEKSNSDTVDLGPIKITISFLNEEEPSLIYTKQKISEPVDITQVERPPYFPRYSELTPEQKWVYCIRQINRIFSISQT